MSEPSRQPDRPALLGGQPVRPQGPPDWPPDDAAIAEALQACFADGSWGKYHGPYGDELVARLCALHDCGHAILCASGTAAVELALRGLRVGPGDEVVLAAYDFKGNFQNVLAVGATPVLIDVHPDNWNLNPAHLDAAIGKNTKAVIASHLHGGVVPMPDVMDVARSRNIAVIEDACQMPGARIHGRVAGTWGDVGVWSFGGSKLLSAGRGGALFTDDAEVVQRLRLYTQRGNEAYPLSELQSAVLLPQLDVLGGRNGERAASVGVLTELLEESGLAVFRNAESDSEPGYFKLGLQYDATSFGGLSRDRFAEAMRAEGIALSPGFRALHRSHSRRRFLAVGELPVASDADDRVLTLHHPVLLEDEPAIEQMATAVAKIRGCAGDLS